MQGALHRFFSRFPVVELDGIRLRDLMLKDTQNYFDMMADPEGSKYQSDEDIPTSLAEAEESVRYWGSLYYKRRSIFWTIAESSSDEFIGTIGFNSWNFVNQRAEISYDLKSSHWRRGIMTKALHAVFNVAFDKMWVNRIEARTMLDNEPSRSLLDKMGFQLEGIQRGYRVIRNQPTDIALYSLTKKDYLDLYGNQTAE